MVTVMEQGKPGSEYGDGGRRWGETGHGNDLGPLSAFMAGLVLPTMTGFVFVSFCLRQGSPG